MRYRVDNDKVKGKRPRLEIARQNDTNAIVGMADDHRSSGDVFSVQRDTNDICLNVNVPVLDDTCHIALHRNPIVRAITT